MTVVLQSIELIASTVIEVMYNTHTHRVFKNISYWEEKSLTHFPVNGLFWPTFLWGGN